jgi:hypothetical protein
MRLSPELVMATTKTEGIDLFPCLGGLHSRVLAEYTTPVRAPDGGLGVVYLKLALASCLAYRHRHALTQQWFLVQGAIKSCPSLTHSYTQSARTWLGAAHPRAARSPRLGAQQALPLHAQRAGQAHACQAHHRCLGGCFCRGVPHYVRQGCQPACQV